MRNPFPIAELRWASRSIRTELASKAEIPPKKRTVERNYSSILLIPVKFVQGEGPRADPSWLSEKMVLILDASLPSLPSFTPITVYGEEVQVDYRKGCLDFNWYDGSGKIKPRTNLALPPCATIHSTHLSTSAS